MAEVYGAHHMCPSQVSSLALQAFAVSDRYPSRPNLKVHIELRVVVNHLIVLNMPAIPDMGTQCVASICLTNTPCMY